MSNEKLIVPERSRDIGNFLVGRLIPFRKKRMVGPFIFIDHMGPTELGPDKYIDIDRHPHIGLSTLTYLFEGEIEHCDSMGTKKVIKPGGVNWMTAGKGVTHTERTPDYLRNGNKHTVHGYQIWVALPTSLENMEPEFHHIDRLHLPEWEDENAHYKLIAGEAFGNKSPVPVHSELFMLEINAKKDFAFNTKDALKGEVGISIVNGEVEAENETVKAGNMMISKKNSFCELIIKKDCNLLIFGGEPFEEERYIHWNFVSSSKNKIDQAKEDWSNDRFPKIEGDDTYVPLPS